MLDASRSVTVVGALLSERKADYVEVRDGGGGGIGDVSNGGGLAGCQSGDVGNVMLPCFAMFLGGVVPCRCSFSENARAHCFGQRKSFGEDLSDRRSLRRQALFLVSRCLLSGSSRVRYPWKAASSLGSLGKTRGRRRYMDLVLVDSNGAISSLWPALLHMTNEKAES